MKWAIVFSMLFTIPISAVADQVTLANGDHLTGKVLKLESGKLALESAYAGTIMLKWEAVKQLVMDTPVYIQTGKDREVKAASVNRSDSELIIADTAGAEVRVQAGDVTVIRSEAERAAYDASLHPGFMSGWAGGANFGFALANGNSKTSNLALGLDLARQTLHDKISLYSSIVYARDRLLSRTTANLARGGARYDRNINPRMFGFGSGDFESSELQLLNLRSTLGGGLGWHALATPRTKIDLLGGLAFTHESYETFTRSFVNAQIGEELTRTLWAGGELKQRAFYYPDLQQTGEYRLAFDLGLTSKLYRALSWQVNVSDRYVTNPPAGTVRNDLLMSTGIALTIGKKK